MANTEVTTSNAVTTFRAQVADVFIWAAKASLYELVDEFLRMSKVILDGTIHHDDDPDTYTDDAKIAFRNRSVVLAAARGRFGLSMEARNDDNDF